MILNISPPWWDQEPLLSPDIELSWAHPPKQKSFLARSEPAHSGTPVHIEKKELGQKKHEAELKNTLSAVKTLRIVFRNK